MLDTLGSFADSLNGLQRLGVVTDLTSSVSARDAGDPFFGLGGDSCRTPRPASNNSGDAVSGHPPQADGQWLQRLVEINMQLFDHANKAKTKAGDSGPAPESSGDNEASSSTIGRPAGFNSFDETIVLSFYLVRALHSLYSPESLKLDEQSPLSVSSPPNLDSGTVLIIFSCYVRVLDLLMDRLGALKSALNATSTNGSSPNGAPLHLPTLVACGCPLEGYPVLRLRSKLPSNCVTIFWIHASILGSCFTPRVNPGAQHLRQIMCGSRSSTLVRGRKHITGALIADAEGYYSDTRTGRGGTGSNKCPRDADCTQNRQPVAVRAEQPHACGVGPGVVCAGTSCLPNHQRDAGGDEASSPDHGNLDENNKSDRVQSSFKHRHRADTDPRTSSFHIHGFKKIFGLGLASTATGVGSMPPSL